MALSRDAFEALHAIAQHPGIVQDDIANITGLPVGSVSSVCKELVSIGAISGGAVTACGWELLEPFRVDNAVILAAGLSSRVAPISYEKPKGILRVRGEVLIERQIEQLREAGITDITVVVGYKKEYFLYLEGKYGVSIVVNDEFASRNNHSSLMVACDRLANTYVCSSDNYFTVNPFRSHEWKAFYSAQYQEGLTDEWCIGVGAQDRIESVSVGGRDAWTMIGHAYFDRAFSERFSEILEREYELPETADKLWEQIYVEHIDELDMAVKRFDAGVMYEFDTLSQLSDFDPAFFDNLDSEVLENITRTLGCTKGEIRDVYPLKQGLTNLSCHFRTDSGEYVYRHPGVGTELLIDRAAEAAALQIAKELGIDDTFVYADPRKGWKISRFIPNCTTLDPHDPAQLAQAMEVARKLHSADIVTERAFDFFDEGKRYEALLLEKGPIEVPGYWEMSAKAEKLREYAAADGAPQCLCHNDFFCLNFLVDEAGKLYLIDWEYAGMSDYANDFGTCTVCCELGFDEAMRALDAYFGRKATFEEIRHNFAFVALAGWCWYVWSLVKESEGDCVGEWLYIYYRYAKEYMDKVIGWYEGAGFAEGEGSNR